MTGMGARVRKVVLFVAAFVLLIALWEGYKAVGPAGGGKLLGWRILPRSEDAAMPHLWDVLRRFSRPELRGSPRTIASVVAAGTWFTMRIALTGFALGVVVGLALAVLMARSRVAERGLLPYVILSQTVPLIALAPLVVSWGGKLSIGGFEWQKWMSAAVISAFLAFFPVAVGGLRGLKSPPRASLELMESYAANGRQTLFKLRFPAAVPYLVPALKLAAAASVVGTVVAEISAGVKGGVGRLILEYSRESTSDPAKKFTAVLGAVVVGLALAALVALVDLVLMRNRPKEQTA
jgi:NitT/TauT family transport system permease protein